MSDLRAGISDDYRRVIHTSEFETGAHDNAPANHSTGDVSVVEGYASLP